MVDQPFTLEILTSLVELTRFETLTPRFSATVPPCWVEVQQEQQQRRHPQHLHQQHHGDAAQHTRTWKLQTDRYWASPRSFTLDIYCNMEFPAMFLVLLIFSISNFFPLRLSFDFGYFCTVSCYRIINKMRESTICYLIT